MAIRLYQNFDLQNERAGNAYRARVLYSPTGQRAVEFALPFVSSELSLFLTVWAAARSQDRRTP